MSISATHAEQCGHPEYAEITTDHVHQVLPQLHKYVLLFQILLTVHLTFSQN